LLVIPSPQIAVETTKPEAGALLAEISKDFDQARQQAELANFEFEESPGRDRVSARGMEATLDRAEGIFALATSLTRDRALDEWQQLPPVAQMAESELRNAAAKRIERAAAPHGSKDSDAGFPLALNKWNEAIAQLPKTNGRTALVSHIATGIQQLG
jgi:hypothetical protein